MPQISPEPYNELPLLWFLFAVFGLMALGLLTQLLTVTYYWVKCRKLGIDITFLRLFSLKWTRTPLSHVIGAKEDLLDAGVKGISVDNLAEHYAVTEDLSLIVRALIAAKRTGKTLSWEQAAEIDLTSRFPKQYDAEAVGHEGTTLSDLDPEGIVQLGWGIYRARSEKGFIPKDSIVVVDSIQRFRVNVKKRKVHDHTGP